MAINPVALADLSVSIFYAALVLAALVLLYYLYKKLSVAVPAFLRGSKDLLWSDNTPEQKFSDTFFAHDDAGNVVTPPAGQDILDYTIWGDHRPSA